jgi:hypothetical protein
MNLHILLLVLAITGLSIPAYAGTKRNQSAKVEFKQQARTAHHWRDQPEFEGSSGRWL